MRARIVRIGNSQGVRLPKPLLEQAGLVDEVELRVEAGQIIIAALRTARAGWAEAAQRVREAGEDRVDAAQPTSFDETEWKWR